VSQPLWSAVDDYWTTKLHAPDDALDAAAPTVPRAVCRRSP
jgi:hypothetical protein